MDARGERKGVPAFCIRKNDERESVIRTSHCQPSNLVDQKVASARPKSIAVLFAPDPRLALGSTEEIVSKMWRFYRLKHITTIMYSQIRVSCFLGILTDTTSLAKNIARKTFCKQTVFLMRTNFFGSHSDCFNVFNFFFSVRLLRRALRRCQSGAVLTLGLFTLVFSLARDKVGTA